MARRYQVVDSKDIPVERSTTSRSAAVKIAKDTGTRKNPSCLVIHYSGGPSGPFQTRRTKECYAAGKRVARKGR